MAANGWSLAAKTLRPLPNEHTPLSDEARVRLRYVDMMVRPEPRDMVRTKATVLKSLRSTLDARDYVEVETPILQLTNGGAAARPFNTHLNALDQDMLLRIALELDLKKAMIGGVDKVYEIGRTFRNEGLDSTHAAEFSMLEAYEAYGDQFTMMELTRALVLDAARAVGRTVVPARDGSEIDLEAEWRQGADPRAGVDGSRRGGHRRDRRGHAAQARGAPRRRAASRPGARPRSSSSSTSSSSRTRWSPRRS